jgi:hypothetical protein
MENATNRVYYDMTSEEQEKYVKDRKAYHRFIIRIADTHFAQFNECFKQEGLKLKICQKDKKTAISRDKRVEYDFNVIPYDNSKSKDFIANHCVLICKHEDLVIVSTKLKEFFRDDITLKKAGKGAITTQIGTASVKRGTWRSKHDLVNSCEQRPIKYPICVVSYSRANKYGKTHLWLTKNKIKHYLFVEPSQCDEYCEWFNGEYCDLVVSGEDFSKEQMGSTPMRNFILDWGKENGYDKVWMLDDNIKGYKRYYEGTKNEIEGSGVFTTVEEYCALYDNVGAVSHNFSPFISEGDCRTCIVKNNKCYSSMLLWTGNNTFAPYNQPVIRFRYKHQEDNLISMEYINKGYCNLCFNHILYDKDTSGKDKGGNAVSIYKTEANGDGEGYTERFLYFEAILKILWWEGKLKLIEGKKPTDLMWRDTTMKSKDYHAKCNYGVLKGFDNQLIRNGVKEDNPLEWEFIEK